MNLGDKESRERFKRLPKQRNKQTNDNKEEGKERDQGKEDKR